ncbi:DUF411 domain-containing protein [Pseudoalteromonas peptidolytica]|uniref:DUF411 domain-containing protein n=1 Tax=Pseudoalteromonas peptidolytica TaxID=61150 RepID=UPI00298E44B8|nr:DUF411 domain-containing protein [Pseudoalteromonas peptidolytica]MDW7551404.1 DUF411 domain-containing protein [Pseudoalteromonas peptidolytica]
MRKLFLMLVLWVMSAVAYGKSHIELEVFKSPTCGCCELWLNHLTAQGISYQATDLNYLGSLKNKFGIKQNYQSCHTGVSKDGFVFEGHVPAKFIKRFLQDETLTQDSNNIGLSVPAMPIGSVGMEMGERFMPFQVLLLKKDGSYEVFAGVSSYEEQF